MITPIQISNETYIVTDTELIITFPQWTDLYGGACGLIQYDASLAAQSTLPAQITFLSVARTFTIYSDDNEFSSNSPYDFMIRGALDEYSIQEFTVFTLFVKHECFLTKILVPLSDFGMIIYDLPQQNNQPIIITFDYT